MPHIRWFLSARKAFVIVQARFSELLPQEGVLPGLPQQHRGANASGDLMGPVYTYQLGIQAP